MTWQSKNQRQIPTEEYVKGIKEGNRTVLARAITLVESNAERHFIQAQQLIESLLKEPSNSIRIGITGVPGAGKSTFIDSFGSLLCNQGHRVAVLAVDPSSQVSNGSIMGDKTRMERLSRHPNAFIRPSPSGGNLGGVSRKTRETILLCEAAGYDVIIVETMGVGQGEFVVREMVDFFLLLVLTGAGDELQTMKKGIMELPDLVVVNKADGDNMMKAERAKQEYGSILHFLKPYTPNWTTITLTASALKETGIKDIWDRVMEFEHVTKKNGFFYERRKNQQTEWLYSLLTHELHHLFFTNSSVKKQLPLFEEQIRMGEKTVSASALEILSLFLEKIKNE
ncbi:methylmalonyl Co-A mutase-associated GTPase MeaB [Bacillus weihaiensis]|uniref:ATPase/protein kinase n=1 Tax=Bacillus weihaiensis TaxID=1547283 RepID=A0A1L3MQ61_9BACI|nr:methylmalonyl Co-A mutase-associated GTPase MeaB [Bacillus weihaiensis]APH04478.1 ATPase/protein kinase [Bacillus weihaiensis]